MGELCVRNIEFSGETGPIDVFIYCFFPMEMLQLLFIVSNQDSWALSEVCALVSALLVTECVDFHRTWGTLSGENNFTSTAEEKLPK